MGLFDRKHCDICGGDIGLFGNTKLSDGNMCKKCAENVSPWLTSKKSFSISEMNDHLQYRQMNHERLSTFITSAVIGSYYKLYVDAAQMQWYITRSGSNPDIFNFNQVSGCDVEIKDYRHELRWEDADGRSHSYNPPEYEYDYDFYLHIYVVTPFTNEITIKLNSFTIEDDLSIEYKQAEADAFGMKSVFDQMMSGAGELQLPGTLVADSLYIADLDAQRAARDFDRQERMRMQGVVMGKLVGVSHNGAPVGAGVNTQAPHPHPVPQAGPTPRQYTETPAPAHQHPRPAAPVTPAPAAHQHPRPAASTAPAPARPVAPAPARPAAPAHQAPPPAARPVAPASAGPRAAAPTPARPVGPTGRPKPPVGPHKPN